ncbi:hypothetical protein [Enterococcus sp. CSURQ0835]|uniref:hypothetical protein n=1 Tax=Enterococcus sp. CSURQ0835 TaxID=2681394 RepID=UPI00190F19FE|nr:hypothetical protein [Enterococcus sp. CSURQ0835]
MYSDLEMLFATYVLKGVENGGRTLESVPAVLRPNVQKIVEEAQSKPAGETPAE